MTAQLHIVVCLSFCRRYVAEWFQQTVVIEPGHPFQGRQFDSADYKRGALSAGGSLVFKNGGEVRVSANQLNYETVRRDLDLYALRKFDARCQLRLSGSSLLGEDYVSASSHTLASSGTQRSRTFYPGSRIVRATLEMKF